MSLNKNNDARQKDVHIVIVGAGIAGIALALKLKRDFNFYNFTIFEKAESVGGTWRDNTYPGCGSDIPGHWYSLSTDLNPNWKYRYPTQPELRVYWEELWQKNDLGKHTKLNTQVTFASWDAQRQVYDITAKNGKTGEEEHVVADVLFYAIGGFQVPKYPDIGGLDAFKGVMFHSARWKHDTVFAGKRVGVIGNGCSAAQFVPEISQDSSVEVINFARTPQWYIPQRNHTYPAWARWIFAHVPYAMRTYRNWLMIRADIGFLAFNKNNKLILKLTRDSLIDYLKHKAPKEYINELIPTYTPGCKRIILDPHFLKCLHRPNVSLRWDAIEGLVEEGVKLKSGEIVPLDIIIFATGYSLDATAEIKVRGAEGTTIKDYFVKKEAPTAYLGSCYPGFPNLFTMLGPNLAVGHGSIVFAHEAQIKHAMQLVKPIIDGTARSFEVTHEATDKYNDWLQKRLSRSVWTDCTSYYQVNGPQTKNFANFPGPLVLMWWITLWPKWDAFRAVEADAWKRQRKYRRWGMTTVILSALVGIASGIFRAYL